MKTLVLLLWLPCLSQADIKCDLKSGSGKSLLEALILASTNPKYDNKLFIDLRVLYKKNTNSEQVVNKHCFECQNQKQCLYPTFSELVFFWDRSRKSMNNLLSYCGLTDSRMSASETIFL